MLESHKRIQRVNQCLEDKLLLLVDKTESEKNVLNSEITRLTRKVTENECQINHLINDNVSFFWHFFYIIYFNMFYVKGTV